MYVIMYVYVYVHMYRYNIHTFNTYIHVCTIRTYIHVPSGTTVNRSSKVVTQRIAI